MSDDQDLAAFISEHFPDPPPPAAPLQEPPESTIEEFLDTMCVEYQELRGPLVPCQELTAQALEIHEPTLPMGNLRTIEYAHELLQRGPYSLVDVLRWSGDHVVDDVPGVVSLYYQGPAGLYRLIRDPASRLPLVFGSDHDCIKRLKGFALSIQQAGLGLENFTARILPLEGKLKEDAKKSLDLLYLPLWHTFDGFLARQYAPDSRGQDSTRSRWDTLHRGRIGAAQVERNEDIAQQVEDEIPNVLVRYRRAERMLAAYSFIRGGRHA